MRKAILKFREGSKKQKTYERFRSRGEAQARRYGRTAGLKTSTLSTWIGSWKRAS
jgi:hypothetical protein